MQIEAYESLQASAFEVLTNVWHLLLKWYELDNHTCKKLQHCLLGIIYFQCAPRISTLPPKIQHCILANL